MVNPSADFSTLQVSIQGPIRYTKHLFIKPHSSATDDLPPGRTLFVSGIPLSIAGEDLVEVLSHFGDVETFALHPSGTTGILVFKEESACKAAITAGDTGTVLELEPAEPEGAFGLKSWVNAHKARFPGNQLLQQQLDEWVEAFDAAQERKRKAADSADDGWTVVKRHRGRQKSRDGEGVSVAGVAAAAAAEAGSKAKQILTTNFYRFQQRERRRDELLQLREKFEADKKKIQEMKAARRFKPM